jgi:hypothetical protein
VFSIVWIAIGLGQTVTDHGYPPGDIRASQGFWIVLGLVTAAIGVAVLVNSIRWFRVLSSTSTSTTTAPAPPPPGTETAAEIVTTVASDAYRGQPRRAGAVLVRLWVAVGALGIGLLTLLSNLGGASAAHWLWVLLGLGCLLIGIVILGTAIALGKGRGAGGCHG